MTRFLVRALSAELAACYAVVRFCLRPWLLSNGRTRLTALPTASHAARRVRPDWLTPLVAPTWERLRKRGKVGQDVGA